MKKIFWISGLLAAASLIVVISPFSMSAPETRAATVISTGGLKSAVVSLASFFKNQKYEYVDDATTTTARYNGANSTWITASGSPFSTTGTILVSGAVKVDLATGLWWSDRTSSTTDNQFTEVFTGGKATGITGGNSLAVCAALNAANGGAGFAGHNDWYLPSQKQLMQAYIDGSNNNLPNPGNNFWSSTEYYGTPASAWGVYLNSGYTGSNAKVTLGYVRCVRP